MQTTFAPTNFGTYPAQEKGATLAEGDSNVHEQNLAEWEGAEQTHSHSKQSRERGIRLQDLAEVTAQLAIMTRSGVDAATAIGSLATQCQRPALARVLEQVHQAVLSGNTLSEALRQQGGVFDARYVATISAGEASGSLAEVLGQLSHMQRLEVRNRRTMRALMTYPILLFSISSAVIIALVLFVLPRFSEIFDQYGVALPLVTQMLITFASELSERWWVWFPLMFASVGALLFWRKTENGRLYLDSLWIHAAVIRDVTRARLTGRMCRLLGIMLSNGVPLLQSLRLTRDAMDNSIYRNMFDQLEDAVTNGKNLASVLQSAEMVPRSAREMIITGEATGNLGEVTALLGDYYDEEAEARMRQLVGLLEPALTVGMGIIVAIVVLAVMLPVFDLSGMAQRN